MRQKETDRQTDTQTHINTVRDRARERELEINIKSVRVRRKDSVLNTLREIRERK